MCDLTIYIMRFVHSLEYQILVLQILTRIDRAIEFSLNVLFTEFSEISDKDVSLQ